MGAQIEIVRGQGADYFCPITNEVYSVKDEKTAVLVTDPARIEAAKNNRNPDWRNLSLEGDSSGRPAGEHRPPAVDASQEGRPSVLSDSNLPTMGSGTSITVNEAIDRLMAYGYSEAAAIGVTANLMAESSLRTDGPTGGQGEEGLAQWKGARLSALQAFSAERGLHWRSKDAQFGFLVHELTQEYRPVHDRLMRATSAEEAAEIFCAGYEIPTLDNGMPNVETYGVRRGMASDIVASRG